jgi:hypothetical protein
MTPTHDQIKQTAAYLHAAGPEIVGAVCSLAGIDFGERDPHPILRAVEIMKSGEGARAAVCAEMLKLDREDVG